LLTLILLALVAVTVGGGVAVERLTRQPRGVKRILAARTRPIGEADDTGDVRIEGVVEVFEGTLTAPLTGRRCVYFEHVVRADGSQDLDGAIVRVADGVPFVVRDASGRAIVDPTGATALLTTLGVDGGEQVLCAGDRVVVIGRGVREPDPDASTVTGTYRDGPATRLRMSHTPQFPLHLVAPDRARRIAPAS